MGTVRWDDAMGTMRWGRCDGEDAIMRVVSCLLGV
jgi:hypothetical protein